MLLRHIDLSRGKVRAPRRDVFVYEQWLRMRTFRSISLLLAFFAANAGATTIAPIDAQSAADLAGQVIHGRVTSIHSYWVENPRRIESAVALEQVEYLKGATAASTDSFTLIVPGGQVGSIKLRIAGAPEFVVGQKWMLFLLPSYRTFPTVGVDQWAFRIQTGGDGVERVFATDGRVVTGIDENGFPTHVASPATGVDDKLVAASGLRVDKGPGVAGTGQAAALSDFLERLRPILSRSRDHALTQPAGRPIPSSPGSVSILGAGGASTSAVRQADDARGEVRRMPRPRRVGTNRTTIKNARDGAQP